MAKKRTNMFKYIIKRILMMIPMLLIVLTITWLLAHMMTFSPYFLQFTDLDDPEVIEAELRRVGYYDPWYIKLLTYYKNFFTGDWGISLAVSPQLPVLDLIAKIFPKTLELMIIPIILSPFIAIKLGVTSSTHKDKTRDTIIRFIAIMGAGFPVFWIATMLQLFFGSYLSQFTMGAFDLHVMNANSSNLGGSPAPSPTAFRTGFRIIDSIIYNDQIFLWDTLTHLFIPSICVTFVSLAGVTRLTRSTMLDVLDQDYIRTARAKGVPEKDVINKHALRNALLPTSNLVIGGTATALLGSLFIEWTFNYRGFGYYMVNAIFFADYFVINGLLIFATLIILSGTLITDIVYTLIDPRITYK